MSNKAIDKDYLLRQLHLFEDDVVAQRQIASEEGYLNFRYYNQKFSYKDGNSWTPIDYIIPVTQEEYDLLTPTQKNKECFYFITNAIAPALPNIVTTKAVDTNNWSTDTTSQSGTTLYKKQVSLNHVYKDAPDISIGAASGNTLPTTAEQTAYDLLKYITVDDTVPCLYLYASAIPTNGFYINVEGVD